MYHDMQHDIICLIEIGGMHYKRRLLSKITLGHKLPVMLTPEK